jgi:acyl carrier protein
VDDTLSGIGPRQWLCHAGLAVEGQRIRASAVSYVVSADTGLPRLAQAVKSSQDRPFVWLRALLLQHHYGSTLIDLYGNFSMAMSAEQNTALIKAFAESLQIDSARVIDELAYNSIPEWDSVAHMTLIAEIEGAFDIMLDTNDVIDMSSVGKAREILRKYDVAV